jgi:hypothetical protein
MSEIISAERIARIAELIAIGCFPQAETEALIASHRALEDENERLQHESEAIMGSHKEWEQRAIRAERKARAFDWYVEHHDCFAMMKNEFKNYKWHRIDAALSEPIAYNSLLEAVETAAKEQAR